MQKKSTGKGKDSSKKVQHPNFRGNQVSNRLQLAVGDEWPEVCRLDVSTVQSKSGEVSTPQSKTVFFLGTVFATLLVALMVYAMATANTAMLDRVFRIVEYGLGLVGVWAIGKPALKVLSGWKDVS